MGSSTPRLSEYAQKFVYPPNISKTVWPRVEAKGRDLGLGFDWWQSQLGTVCLGYNEAGRYVATVGGIGMSIPRQVGKTYFVLAMLVIMCILFPGLQVVWSAHHLRTSTKTFKTLQRICRRKKVAPLIARNDHGGDAIRTANGEQEVEFTNGSRIMFGARSRGFGRGFDEIDIEVYDEAQILDTKALDDAVAALNQARHEHGGLLFYMGTPPRPTDPSDAFTERRAEAWSGDADDAIWLEIGADPGSDPDDRSQWPKMNPSFPTRTPLESLLRLRKNLKNEDSWNREGRGIWDDDGVLTALPMVRWNSLADLSEEPLPPVGRVVLAVDSTPDQKRVRTSITACGVRADGLPMLELIENLPGVDWAEKTVLDLLARNPEIVAVVIDKRSTAAVLIERLEAAKAPVFGTDATKFARAWTQFRTTVVETGMLRHSNQIELNEAVKNTGLRMLGDAEVPDRKHPTDDITPLIAAMLALYGLTSGFGVVKNAGRGRAITLG